MASSISIDIERLINGDENVFKSLFDHSYIGMVQRAVYYTNDLNAAEDIVQEVFMRLWEKRGELRKIQNIQGYLLFSIRNKCLNLLEHQQVMDKYRIMTKTDYKRLNYLCKIHNKINRINIVRY